MFHFDFKMLSTSTGISEAQLSLDLHLEVD